jgi:lysophospholipase L1-like esterase
MRKGISIHITLFLMSIYFVGCKSQPTKQELAFKSIEGKTHSAVTPTAKSDASWMRRYETANVRLKEGNVDLLYIGDSITQGFEGSGRQVWNKYYAPRNAVNMGISGDRTQNALWRLDNSDFNNVKPKLAIVMIGTNNSNGRDNTSEEIADGIIAICQRLRTKLPQTKILLLAIFPRGSGPSSQREKNAKASELASQTADGKMIYYLDINKKFLTDEGLLAREIMPDFLHPNAKGYEIWADAIEPKVAKLMGEN